MPISAREAALRALTRYRRDAAYSDAALNTVLLKENLEDRESALAARIFYGVIQNMALLDFYISAYSTVRPSQMEPQVLDILRLSAYQLVFMSKIPASAAVSEGVELAKRHANPRASALVNAVLRKLSSTLDRLPELTGAELDQELSIRYSHPVWLVRNFLERLGADETRALLEANNGDNVVYFMVNTLKTDVESALTSLRGEGCDAQMHPWLTNCVILRSMRHIGRLTAFRQGLVYVQDPAAALAVLVAEPKAGMRIIDGCAAPGGKSFAAAIAIKDAGCILSCDVNEKKLGRIKDGARRLGLTAIKTRVLDARVGEPSLYDSADIVLADVPCSGFGVIRKKPEIRFKREEDIAALPELQLGIANTLARYVKPGGILLYSTCTLLERENEEIVTAFLRANGDFQPEPFDLQTVAGARAPFITADTGMLTLWPHRTGTDGFFIAKLRRSL